MKKTQTSEALTTSFALLLTFAGAYRPLETAFIAPAMAQSATDTPSVPNPTTVRIDGSNSMKVTNDTRQRQLEQGSPGTAIKANYNGTDAALRSVLNGETDLAAVGRPLTPEEKAQGLVIAPREPHKIAIVVGADNPFRGDITFAQFAQIFRGEITNWSELGGAPGAIQLVDQPETSDTRQALQRYKVFQQAPFVAADNAIKLPEENTEAMIQKLSTGGISYTIADQVTDTPGVRIVPMHGTLPADSRYPFSQPLAYAYKAPVNSAVAAFLGIAAVPSVVSPVPTAPVAPQVTSAPVNQPTDDRAFPWWLLLVPLLGGLLWWLLTRSRTLPAIAPVAAAPAVPMPLPVAPVAPVAPPIVLPIAPVALDERSPDIKLYEERLVAGKTRQKVGDVTFDKRVETEQVEISVPIKTERIVIEHSAPTDSRPAISGDVTFGIGGTRIETYEETPEVRKETFVREEVRVRKEIDHEIVSAEDTLRREELDIDTLGQLDVDQGFDHDRGNGYVKHS
jgi:uncharacterized protein (TIGR02271 family)